jgi:hypothetical protein
MADIEYGDGGKLIAGKVTTDQLPMLAGTYHRGMELEFDTTGYKPLAVDANVAAIFNQESVVLGGAGFRDCIVSGEINPEGLVDGSNVAKTLTEAQRATRRNRRFDIKRV